MPVLHFFPYTITYKVVDNKPLIYLFGKTDTGKQICCVDPNFQPYFYVIPKDEKKSELLQKKIASLTVDKHGKSVTPAQVTSIQRNYQGIKQKVFQVITHIPSDVPPLREAIAALPGTSVHEADILFTRRYCIDKGIIPLTEVEVHVEPREEKAKVPVFTLSSLKPKGESVTESKVLAFDIETYWPKGTGYDPKKNPILTIALYGNNFQKVLCWKQFRTKHSFIEFVKDEAELLKRFIALIEEFQPDLLCGYYSEGFDFPYILQRAEKHKIPLTLGLDYSTPSLDKTRETVQVTGIVHLDILTFIRNVLRTTLETDSYDLNAVAAELLGDKKKEVDIGGFAEIWDKGSSQIEAYCEYNLHDAQLTYRLAQELMPSMVEFVKIIGQPMDDVTRMSFSQLVEWYVLRQAFVFQEIAYNKPEHDLVKERMKKTFQGAFVLEPKPGLHNDLVVFDFRSLYPTIIASHNISPETFCCACCKETAKPVPLSDEHYWFCKKRKGFLSTVIEDIIMRRSHIKELMKKTKDEQGKKFLEARSQGLKLLANSFYGYFGFYASRWYSLECSRCIAAYGRHYIHQVIETATKNGFQTIYSDTDSIFLTLSGKKLKDALVFQDAVNKDLPGIMELDLEGHYPAGIFVSLKMGDAGAKKKYALLREDNTIKIRGFELVRRNWSPIAKEVQEKVIAIILKEKSTEKALKYVQGIIHDLQKKAIPLEKVIMRTQIQKPLHTYDQIGPHVAAARRMEEQGMPVTPGSMIQYVIIKGTEKIRDRARLPHEAKAKDYDAEYYINNQIMPSVERIFEALGYEKDQLTQKTKQKKLDVFFAP
ncbi:ribonuclease H-like domain-containing protein [Candidatus Woesearchaeota archaeon]|nr:ribonuclease H-like domain-containing protein [Candidatus Woesearchaeota archaeon]